MYYSDYQQQVYCYPLYVPFKAFTFFDVKYKAFKFFLTNLAYTIHNLRSIQLLKIYISFKAITFLYARDNLEYFLFYLLYASMSIN